MPGASASNRVLTCSSNEAAVWGVKHEQPLLILDEPGQDISQLQTVLAYDQFAACVGAEHIALYQLPKTVLSDKKKSSGAGAATTSVKTCDCRVTLNNKNSSTATGNIQGQILACQLETISAGGKKKKANTESSVSLTVVYGTLYKIEKRKISLTDQKVGGLRPHVSLLDSDENSASLGSKKNAKGTEENKDQ